MDFAIVPAHELSFDVQTSIFNRAFAGYLAGWNDLDSATLALFIRGQGADLCYSRFLGANGALVGFGYINRIGNVVRLAGMGIVPEGRRTGASSFLLSRLLDEAKSRGDEAMVLEVFEQNLPGLALYRRHKFRELMRLLGWRRKPQKLDEAIQHDLEEISLITAAQISSPIDFPDFPWPGSRHAVAKTADARAYKIEDASVVISNPNGAPIRVLALLGESSDALRNVLGAVLARFQGIEFFARETFPEVFGHEIFEPLGFTKEPLNQILMRHDL